MKRQEAEPAPSPDGLGAWPSSGEKSGESLSERSGESSGESLGADTGGSPFLEDYLLSAELPDEILGEAYEATPPEQRALIKSSLALVQALHTGLAGINGLAGPSCVSGLSEHKVEFPGTDYGLFTRSSPAPWAILALGPGDCSAVRLAAAIMPAHLAGVTDIVAVWTGGLTGAAIPQALLAALELAGVERAFTLPAELPPHMDSLLPPFLLQKIQPSASPLAALLAYKTHKQGQGRLLLFSGANSACAGQDLLRVAQKLKLPVWEDKPPRLVQAAPGVRLDRESLAWAHPELEPERHPLPSSEAAAAPDVFYGTPDDFAVFRAGQTGRQASPLVLAPGLEGLWFHRDLPLTFFINAETAVFRRANAQPVP